MRTSTVKTALAVVVVLLLAGCTSGPTADASSLETSVAIQPTSGDPEPVASTAPVAVGDVVTTDSAGLSEVTFADGSYTRVGPSSELRVVELSTAEAQRTVTGLEIAETWHRVKELAAEDATYEVETPVGTASVRGTVFAVVCTSATECTFTVLEGEVEVELEDGTTVTVNAFERLTVPGEQTTPFPVDLIQADEWIMRNLELDEVDLSTIASAAGIEDWQASTAGTWHAVYTVVASDISAYTVGDVLERDWTVDPGECSGSSCAVSVVSSGGAPFVMDVSGGGLTWGAEEPAACYDVEPPFDLRTDYGFDLTTTTTLTPSTVSDIDGVPTVTQLTGTRTVLLDEKVPPDPACEAVQPHTSATYSVTVTRTDG
ncbi:FecR family protein [Rathayibacter oskolensis]|uniref:FecR family protein n=1 Tax=Rathayibacter oskolensis TaxID=1891671 RepID=A0A1X7NW44_9MICO|nr:FecR domain-containing protein [Rathayibacter oskolensis]SMH42514.1 FecR family protein [Rathayibacter oskolensis]